MTQASSISLVIMAAGIGSRFGGDKQITPIAPDLATFFEYTLYDAMRSGIRHVVLVIRPEMDDFFREQILKKIPKNLTCDIVHQTFPFSKRKKPWGTGHAILCAQDKIRDYFMTANADDFYGREAIQSLAQYLPTLSPGQKGGACIAYLLKETLSSSGPVSRGICHCDERGDLRGIIENEGAYRQNNGIITNARGAILSPDAPVSMNLLGFTSAFMDKLQQQWELFYVQHASSPSAEFGFPTTIRMCSEDPEWKIKVLLSKSSWIGVTYRDDLSRASDIIHQKIQQETYPQTLWS
ncbi:MAG: NTP transferase domain-containing protein [Puniceicoccales bacterium]|nr:NTP transferase domain-containing protein [Puniceicoccales bacterium]